MHAAVTLGATVAPDMVDAPFAASRRTFARLNASIASGRSPSGATGMTRRTPVGECGMFAPREVGGTIVPEQQERARVSFRSRDARFRQAHRSRYGRARRRVAVR